MISSHAPKYNFRSAKGAPPGGVAAASDPYSSGDGDRDLASHAAEPWSGYGEHCEGKLSANIPPPLC